MKWVDCAWHKSQPDHVRIPRPLRNNLFYHRMRNLTRSSIRMGSGDSMENTGPRILGEALLVVDIS